MIYFIINRIEIIDDNRNYKMEQNLEGRINQYFNG